MKYRFTHFSFYAFASFCRLFFVLFLKINFIKHSFWNIVVVQNDLDPDQGRCRVGSDMGPSCFSTFIIPQMTCIKVARKGNAK